MTSTPQQPEIPTQSNTGTSQKTARNQSTSATQGPVSTAPAVGRSSYAAATKHSLPPNASTSTNMATAIEGSAPSQHGHEDAMNSVNGTVPIISAIPPFEAQAAMNGSGAVSANLPPGHDRQSSLTVTPSGVNGGVLPGGPPSKAANIQFGSVNNAGGSPGSGASPALANSSPANLGVAGLANPRMISPQASPSPVPRAVISGGRPPSSLQNHSNPLVFGQSGPEATEHAGQVRGMGPKSFAPTGPQAPDIRRVSSHSSHGDMGNYSVPGGPGRGGYTMPGGRGGRSGFQGQHLPQQMPYSPQPNYRGAANQRVMPNVPPFQGRTHPYPNSPNLGTRSPAMMNAHPAPPQMPHMSHMSMVPGVPGQQYGYQGHPGYPQQGYPQLQLQADPSLTAFYNSGAMQSGQPNHGYPPPASPRPNYAPGPGPQSVQPHYNTQSHHHPQHAPSMSRTSSQLSTSERPPSGPGQQSTPAPPASARSVSRAATSSPVPRSDFIVPPKKSAALIIKNAEGVVQPVKTRPPGSPSRATPSPVKGGTPSIPASRSRSVSRADASHGRTDSANDKSGEEKRKAMQDAVAKKIAEDAKRRQEVDTPQKDVPDQEGATTSTEEDVSANEDAHKESELHSEDAEAEAKTVEEVKPPGDEAPAAEGPSTTDSSEKQAPPSKDQPGDDDDLEAMIKQMEAEEAAREKEEGEKEAIYQAKKQADKEAQKQREAEEEAAYLANMQQAEREAEEADEARQRKRVEAAAHEDQSKAPDAPRGEDAPTPPTNESPAVCTPVESGTLTPVSDTSMGPPSKSVGTNRRDKPGALTLETAKHVEPPQPSAGMKALRSARFLKDPSQIEYPSAVASPNPALNNNAPADRKFKYNKEFLLQFKDVFKEKPSVDWDARIRDTVGDGGEGSARPSSARTPSAMGARNNSNRPSVVQGFSGMGSFNAPPRAGPPTLPPGTTSAERFAMSTQPMSAQRGGPMQSNPFAFGRPQGMPLAGSVSRNSSSNALAGQMSPSTRVGSSQRGNNRAGSKRDKASMKRAEDENKNMPMTASMDLKPIQTSSTGWKPRTLAQGGGGGPAPDGHMAPDMVQRKVKGLLNKMTPEKFEKIADQILEIAGQSKNESDGRTLRQVIQLTFEKATDEAHWASTYALFCERMLKFMSPDIKDQNIKDKHGNVVTGGALFRKYLLTRCQEEFERGWKVNMPAKQEGQTEEAALMSEEYYVAAAAKRRGLGLVKFIGELYKLSMLTERIMHECVKKLLELDDSGPDESEVESLVSLLNTVGHNLEQSEKGPALMNVYFERIVSIMNHPDLPSRLNFKLLDVIDLRKRGWRSKNDDKGPKTIAEIHADEQRKQQEAQVERLRQQSNSRGGGNRMQMGRGDNRNFPAGRGMPPPDYTSNNIGPDDLRRLGARATRNTSNPGGPNLGPTSLFSSGRTNSSRRGLGPGPIMNREDSAASSRTGTPPQPDKEKKKDGDKSSTNTFSALASLEAETANQAASPPSTTSSPPTTKLRPAIERQRSKSPEKGNP